MGGCGGGGREEGGEVVVMEEEEEEEEVFVCVWKWREGGRERGRGAHLLPCAAPLCVCVGVFS